MGGMTQTSSSSSARQRAGGGRCVGVLVCVLVCVGWGLYKRECVLVCVGVLVGM
jgi:hypothetical protein